MARCSPALFCQAWIAVLIPTILLSAIRPAETVRRPRNLARFALSHVTLSWELQMASSLHADSMASGRQRALHAVSGLHAAEEKRIYLDFDFVLSFSSLLDPSRFCSFPSIGIPCSFSFVNHEPLSIMFKTALLACEPCWSAVPNSFLHHARERIDMREVITQERAVQG